VVAPSLQGVAAPQHIELKSEIDPGQASRILRERSAEGRNLRSFGVGPGMLPDLLNRFLEWVEGTEVQLRYMTLDHDVVTMLHSARHWEIRRLGSEAARPVPLIQLEVELQVEALELLANDLEQRVRRLSATPGRIAVLDTNVLLHYEPPENVDWAEVLGEPPIRLVIPLRVVEELDEKKYARRADLADRARRLLPRLEKALGAGGTAGQLRPGATIEVPLDPAPRTKPIDADQEVLDTCQELRQFTGEEVVLVTGDTAMRIRAEARRIPTIRMPLRYERSRITSQPA
jgi:rRNA-processing protein FCF1